MDTNFKVSQWLLYLTLVVITSLVTSQLQETKVPPVIIQEPTEGKGSCPSANILEEVTNELNNNISMLLSDTILPTYFAGKIFKYPATSCKDIRRDFPSGYYWIQTPNNGVLMQYCDQNQRCNCSHTTALGGWMRVANIDMSDEIQECPPQFRIRETPRRSCEKPTTGCTSTFFPTFGVEYSRVCGRVNAYQIGTTDAFLNEDDTIDENYVDGVSVTYNNTTGSRQHIWTFASAHDDTNDSTSVLHVCTCTRTDLVPFSGSHPPTYVGQDYFCETAAHDVIAREGVTYADDPLWDGQGCGDMSSCCDFNNPPWFCKQLLEPTTSDIEMRLCHSATREDSPIERVEIYVQ